MACMTLLLATDIRIAAQHATFSLAEVKRGIIPGNGGTQRVLQQVPYAIGMEMLMTGEGISADKTERHGLINQVVEREGDGVSKAARIIGLTLQFAERNPGMARVMVGDALVHENERLQQRMNHFFDRIELSLRQVLRESAVVQQSTTPTVESQVRASVLTAFAVGRLQRFCRSGFKKPPTETLDAALALLS